MHTSASLVPTSSYITIIQYNPLLMTTHPLYYCNSSSILHHNGDNSYLSKKGGLSFGIRKTFVRDHEGEGVISVPLAAQEEGETAEAIIRESLKFQEPKLEELPQIPKLSNEMTAFLIEHMDIDLMNVELLDAWAVEMFGFAGDDDE